MSLLSFKCLIYFSCSVWFLHTGRIHVRTEKILSFLSFSTEGHCSTFITRAGCECFHGWIISESSSGTTLPGDSSLAGKLSRKPGTRKKFSKHQAKIPNGPDDFQAAFYLPQLSWETQRGLTSPLGTRMESEEVNNKNRARKSQRQDRKDKNVALEELFQKQTRWTNP